MFKKKVLSPQKMKFHFLKADKEQTYYSHFYTLEISIEEKLCEIHQDGKRVTEAILSAL